MKTKYINFLQIKEQFEYLKNIKFEYITSADDVRLLEIEKLATDFFGTEEDPSQIQSTPETYKHFFNIGGINPIAIDISANDMIGWGAAIPTTKDLMNEFLNNNITEAELFKNTKSGFYDAIYFISVFIKPKYRNFNTTISLIKKSIEPIYNDNCVVFYDAFSNEGDKIGKFLKDHSKYKIIKK